MKTIIRTAALTFLSCVALLIPLAEAQSFKSLYSFTGQYDGGLPGSPLLRDGAGTLYGAAFTSANGTGNGTLFKLSSSGKFSLLQTFQGEGGHGTGGANPLGGFIRDAQGDIYGLTEFGGVQNEYGVAFKLPAGGKERVLHTFTGPPKDGAVPVTTLLAGSSGMFYGTTAFGGSGRCRGGMPLCGTVFAIDSAGHYTIIHNFQGGQDDGIEPWGNLVQDSQGNIYGTTMGGGPQSSPPCGPPDEFGCGTIFKLSPNADGSWTESILYSFTGLADGLDPDYLAIDAQGNLYGAALFGGSENCPGGCGTIFKVDIAGKFTVIHRFERESTGMRPYTVTLDGAGNLYGSSNGGHTNCGLGCGIVFKIDLSGKYSIVHAFSGKDGAGPGALLFDDKTGTMYSVTKQGGSSNWGTIFQIQNP